MSNQEDEKFNTESVMDIADDIIRGLELCRQNKSLYQTDKIAMLRMIKFDNPKFYERHPRICRTIANGYDIDPLLGMIQTFAKVQAGEISWKTGAASITNALNAEYCDPVLNSDKLVKEREDKQKNIDVSNN